MGTTSSPDLTAPATITPIDTMTDAAGAPISVGEISWAIAANNQSGTSVTVGHPVAISPDGESLYIGNTLDNTVVPVNLTSGQPGSAIHLDAPPLSIVFAPSGATAYVGEAGDVQGEIQAITVATRTPAATILTPAPNAAQILVRPDGKTLYAVDGLAEPSTYPGLAVIDIGPERASATSVDVRDAGGILLSPDGRTLYALNQHGHASSLR